MTFLQYWLWYTNILGFLFPLVLIVWLANPHKCACGYKTPFWWLMMRHREKPHKHIFTQQ